MTDSPIATPAGRDRFSIFGKTSFTLAMVTGPLWIMALFLTFFAATHREESVSGISLTRVLGFTIMVGLLVNTTGFVFGFIAILRQSQTSWMSIVGFVANGLAFLAIVSLLFFGISQSRSAHQKQAASSLSPYGWTSFQA